MDNINILANGEASFAYNKERGLPWHHLGTPVDGDMPLHVMLAASHSDYEVTLEPLYVATNDGVTEVEGHWATVRTGGGMPDTPLGIVKSRYAVTQIKDLAEVGLEVVGLAKGDACIDTMGNLGKGERWFMYIRLPRLNVDPFGINDAIDLGLVATTSFDGTLANTLMWSSTRVVCANTLAMAFANAVDKISVKHTATAEERLKAAAAGLSMYQRASEALARNAEAMLRVPGNVALDAVLKRHWPKLGEDTNDASRTKRDNVREDIVRLYASGPNNAQIVGQNGWAVYNAAVEYLDWDAKIKTTTNRMERIVTSTILEDQKRSIAKTVLDLVPA